MARKVGKLEQLVRTSPDGSNPGDRFWIATGAGVRVGGYVEHVNRRTIEGWIAAGASAEVALSIDGVERLRQIPEIPRPDAVAEGWEDAKGYRFYPAACRLEPGTHLVEVIPTVGGRRTGSLPGMGIPDTVFELEIPAPVLADLGLLEYLKSEYGVRPEIRRVLIADPRIRYRPERWVGDVIFVDGLPGSPSSRYRIGNIQEELIGLGFDCCTLTEDELWLVEQGAYSAGVVHFFRAPLSGAFARAAKIARSAGARIGFDIDDLAFDPGVMPYIDGLRMLTPEAIEQYRAGMLGYRLFAQFADFVTTTTEFLASHLRPIADQVSVIANSISRAFFAVDYGQAPRGNQYVRIGYYAGTRTHQSDFAVVSDALIRVLRGYPNLRVRLVGEIDLTDFPDLARFTDRVEQCGLLSYGEMLRDMATCDITIAPLEPGNPYCEAKSELKYFEGALTGSAVVASPTQPFAEAIETGRTGFLATTTVDWFRAFCRLLDDADLVARMNSAARQDIRTRYHASVVAKRFIETAGLADAPIEASRPPQLPTLTAQPTGHGQSGAAVSFDVGFFLPRLTIGSGGHRKILRICHDLEQMGHTVSIYVTGGQSPAECRELITRHYYPFAGRLFRYNGTVTQHEFLVATAWETAYLVRRHRAMIGQPVYFVQDFEPLFMPVGSGYLNAFATYMFGFRTICLGRWMAARLRREFGIEPSMIPFPLDRTKYYPAQGVYRKGKSVLLFARPSQERRAFTLAVEALEKVVRRSPCVQIGFFGEKEYSPQRFSYQNHGLIQSETELAQLYRSSTVGICLSPTNPSLVAYEMMACGTALVDLALPGAQVNFEGRDIAYLAQPTAEDLAAQILLALDDDELRARRSAAGIELTSRMEFDDSMAVQFERYLREFRQQSSRPQIELLPPSSAHVTSPANDLASGDADSLVVSTATQRREQKRRGRRQIAGT
jgi:glycosyltransferase involved in cell wall biosynthesis